MSSMRLLASPCGRVARFIGAKENELPEGFQIAAIVRYAA